MDVELSHLDDALLERLLDAAVAGADPLEVMPPVDGPPGWTDARRDAFRTFHRERSLHTDTPVETTYVILAGGTVVGAVRLEPVDAGTEVGIWLSRAVRGQGVGRAAIAAVAEQARIEGVGTLIAETTADNAGAVRLLRVLGAELDVDGAAVHGVVPLAHGSGRSIR